MSADHDRQEQSRIDFPVVAAVEFASAFQTKTASSQVATRILSSNGGFLRIANVIELPADKLYFGDAVEGHSRVALFELRSPFPESNWKWVEHGKQGQDQGRSPGFIASGGAGGIFGLSCPTHSLDLGGHRLRFVAIVSNLWQHTPLFFESGFHSRPSPLPERQ
jgi:hypothetical protein